MEVPELVLVSHHLCPYVQRAAIALQEKNVPYAREYIDLSDKPDWFILLSPQGKVPLLKVSGDAIFESSAIIEYLEDTQPNPLHPADPLQRARHRGWIEYASAILNGIAGVYMAREGDSFEQRRLQLRGMFEKIETALKTGPWFEGAAFSLVDASFAPVFRYFDVFDQIADFEILTGLENTGRWRRHLARRSSVRKAVDTDYNSRLFSFFLARHSFLSGLAAAERIEFAIEN